MYLTITCIVVILICLVVQVYSAKNFLTTGLSVLLMVITYVLTVLVQNDDVAKLLVDHTGFNKKQLILIFSLAYASSTLIGFIYQSFKLSKFKETTEFADYVVKEDIQKELNILRDILKNKQIFGDDFFISIYYPKGIFLNKKLRRICHSGNIPTTPAGWDGVITKIGRTQTGRAYKSRRSNSTDFMNLSFEDKFDGLGENMENWSKSQLSYRICIPFTQKIKFFNIRESELVYFIISINCFKREVDLKDLTEDQKRTIDNLYEDLRKNCEHFANYYKYYNSVL